MMKEHEDFYEIFNKPFFFGLAFWLKKKVKLKKISSNEKGGRMSRKIFSVTGIILLLSVLNSCGTKPEESLLKRYFSALTLNDRTTLSTMAIEPISIDAQDGWEIISVTEEKVEPAILPELNQIEMEMKKKLEDHVAPTLDMEDALYEAKEKLKNARTAAARRAAQKEVEEAQARFDEERELHSQIQKEYNDVVAEARKEEKIAEFSLGAGRLPNIRDLTGDVHSMEVDVRAKGQSGTEDYRFYLRRYLLTDETLNITHRGRWIIVKIEALD